MADQIIAVDLGGTQIRSARFDSRLSLLQRENTLTRSELGPRYAIERIKEYVGRVMPADRDRVTGIGVSSPGPLDPGNGVIIEPPNLPGWLNVPLAEILASEFNLPVFLGNDANVAALAEASKGAAQGCRHVIYLTVSTGIGSGVISHGKLVTGRRGLAAELGHMPIIVEHDRVSSVELEAAGPAIARRAARALADGAPSLLHELAKAEQRPIDAEQVANAARLGDPLAMECLAYAGRIIGLSVVTALHLFNPEIVVIGGGVAKSGDSLFKPLRQAVYEHVLNDIFTADLRIQPAALGDDVALVGAAALVATEGGNIDISELDRRF